MVNNLNIEKQKLICGGQQDRWYIQNADTGHFMGSASNAYNLADNIQSALDSGCQVNVGQQNGGSDIAAYLAAIQSVQQGY